MGSGDNCLVAGVEDRYRALSRSYLFEGMSTDDLKPLARTATVRRLRRGEPVWQVGDRADELCVVVGGEVKDSVLTIDGEEVVHFLHGPGMTLGEPGFFAVERNRIVPVVATKDSTLLQLHRLALVPFMDAHPAVKDRVIERLASNTRIQTNLISTLLTRPLLNRLVLRLIELADRTPDRPGPPRTPPISQSLLASMVGVSRENVNRALIALTGTGAIRRVDGCYELLQEDRLRELIARDWRLTAPRDHPS